MFQLFLQCFTKKYFKFSGRASRKEYWSFQLFFFIFFTIISTVLITTALSRANNYYAYNVYQVNEAVLTTLLLVLFLTLPFMLPGLAVTVRRLHDLNITGWLVLINFLPFIGYISSLIMIIAFCFRGTVGDNKYGPDPIDQNELLNTEQN